MVEVWRMKYEYVVVWWWYIIFFFLVNYDLCIYALRVVNMRRPMDC